MRSFCCKSGCLEVLLQQLGYRGEVGYQTFLYSNESDIRRVFMFLVERLPKAGAESTEETLGASLLFCSNFSVSILALRVNDKMF